MSFDLLTLQSFGDPRSETNLHDHNGRIGIDVVPRRLDSSTNAAPSASTAHSHETASSQLTNTSAVDQLRIEDCDDNTPRDAATAGAEETDVDKAFVEAIEPDFSVARLIEAADGSAGKLVNLVAKHFPSFRDEARFDGRKVRFMKRAQIFVADLWAAMNGKGLGDFDDIGQLTMFAGEMLILANYM